MMNPVATYGLIGVNILVFIAESMRGGSTNTKVALKFGAQYTPYLEQGQWYRLCTAMFLHFGYLHLVCNMYSLYNLGPALEDFFGIPVFLFLYLFSGLAGNILTYVMEKRTGKRTISAGASGAVFGLLGSYLVFALWPGFGGVSLYGVLRVLLINAVYTFANRRINAMAHLGGLIGGVAVTCILLFTLAK
jgi:rhomboid protease GluP